MAGVEEDVWVEPEAKPPVAESRVAVMVDEPKVAIVRLPKGERRRVDGEVEEVEVVGSKAEESEVEVEEEGIIVATTIPRAPRGMQMVGRAPVGPSGRVRGNFGRGVVNPNFPMFFNHAQL